MNTKTFEKAALLAEQRQHLMISTTDRYGIPHIASVGGFECLSPDRVTLSDWHCPATLSNLQQNNQVSLVVWDIVTDTGYQFIGQVESIRPANGSNDQELVVRVHQVMDFNHRGHTDLEDDGAAWLSETKAAANAPEGTHAAMDAHRRRAYLYVRRSLGI